MKKKIWLVVLVMTTFTAQALVRMPHVFSDHMVLQREQEIPVWGWADRRERVQVSFQGKTYTTRADQEGKWRLNLAPSAAGGPFILEVKGSQNHITYQDVLVGDVWMLGGQSNMEWPLKNTNHGEDSIAVADFPMIRLFEVGRNMSLTPISDVPEANWSICTPESVANFSAIGYYFGKQLHLEKGIPVGLLDINWGGTVSEAWTSHEALRSHPDFSERVANFQSGPVEGFDPEEKRPNLWPTSLFYGMLEPIIPFGIKGALWYQGESNAPRAYQYREIFPLMIQDWRKHWGQGDFPFIWVQLANFKAAKELPGESDWAELREAQSMTLSLPHTGQAVIIEKGEANDIHPRDKWTVANRLYLAAAKVAYGQEVVFSGPVYKAMKTEGNTLRVSFDHVGSGLWINDRYGYVKGFAVAGTDRQFHWVKGTQDGNDILLDVSSIANPVAIRYGWADNPDDVNVYNKEGLPLEPFRTDDWQGITYGKK
ncbi:Sialic acid-specific 9-O-acetylesterase [Lunatimonas lonarensis]|uniref:Sialic acid-specific 9-O-acetylesterase n=1 Tax=Lunatimonas lonarensis TaxID=1232681 RepID=R7ZSA3_9BACT|nr:sialate O-acetylesterase [Lunatimonas lonarensis]EON76985.1 Sialic acid-specific 9-O-acetylesterase [Lunatimonas lonarensis]